MNKLLMGLLVSAILGAVGCSGSSSPGDTTDSFTPSPSPTPTPSPTPMPTSPPAQSSACNDPAAASMPATPAAGQSRAGLSCAIHIPIPADSDIPGEPAGIIAFQVFEPGTLTGGENYPLILEGHGFSASRQTMPNDTGSAGLSVPTGPIVRAGYGMISIDQAGHGETGGDIRVMDPDQEGKFLLAILDWAEDNLDWLAYGPDADAGQDNLLLGAIGPSYGGGYQLLIHAVDPQKRLDVLVPQITWHDLSYSLFPGGVPKSLWGGALFGLGNRAGDSTDVGHFDPFVQRVFAEALSTGAITDEGRDYFRYHGIGYFCDQMALPTNTNGDDGDITTAGDPYDVDFQPVPPTQVHTLLFQGMRDVLFNFTESYRTYECLRAQGGDVRLLTYQSGHNTIPVVPDPNGLATSLIGTCGEFDPTIGAIAFFDEYLKGQSGAINAVLPTGDQICMSLDGTDAVLVDASDFPVGTQRTTMFDLPDTTVIAGVSSLTPAVLPYDFATDGDVLAGIPQLTINIASNCSVLQAACDAAFNPDRVTIFAGVAVRDGPAAQWELADNMVYPIRGLGDHDIELIGIGERFTATSELAVAFYGTQEQFAGVANVTVADPVVLPVTITGTVHMPLLTADLYAETAP